MCRFCLFCGRGDLMLVTKSSPGVEPKSEDWYCGKCKTFFTVSDVARKDEVKVPESSKEAIEAAVNALKEYRTAATVGELLKAGGKLADAAQELLARMTCGDVLVAELFNLEEITDY